MSDDKKKEIRWEDYRANYIENTIIDDEDIDDIPDEEDDDGDEPGVSQINNFMSSMGFQAVGSMMGGGHMVNTPWGPFSQANKFAPFNFYELKIAHFKGFSTHSIAEFTKLMDSIDGVAVWKALDPYCVVIGKGRIYTWEEVSSNVRDKLIGNSNDHSIISIESIVKDTIAKNNRENISEYTAAVFPNGVVVQLTPSDKDYLEKLTELEELKNKMAVIIIQNGAVKC